MVGASKILTVSYGTFSCTLEGFDEPFSTMKAIAEYFRDLAADDRYFGAEPPTPDADMLHKIAEREIHRRVEAKIKANGIVLRPEGAQDTLSGAIDDSPSLPNTSRDIFVTGASDEELEARGIPARAAIATTAETTAETKVTTSPVVSSPTENSPAAPTTATSPAPGVTTHVTTVQDMPLAAPAANALPDAQVAETVAAKLQRIRSAVAEARSRESAASGFTEDQHADTYFRATEPQDAGTPESDFGFELDIAGPIEQDEDALQDMTAQAPQAEQEVTPDVSVEAEEVPAQVQADEDQTDEGQATEVEADQAQTEEAQANEIRQRRIKRRAARAEAAALAEAEAARIAAETVPEEAPEIETETAFESAPPRLRARVIKVRRQDVEAAESAAPSESAASDVTPDMGTEDPTEASIKAVLAAAGTRTPAVEASVSAPAKEPEARPATAPTADFDDDALFAAIGAQLSAEEDALAGAPAADRLQESADLAPTLSDDAEDDLAAELAALEKDWENETSERVADAAEDKVFEQDQGDELEEEASAELDAPSAAPRAQTESARALVREGNDEADVSRLMREANTKLEGPENRRRFSAIAHLKAAVAATVADRKVRATEGKPEVDTVDTTEAYREDLTRAVRPRRPSAAGVATPRPSAPALRAAPLMLVSEQRVVEAPLRSVEPVRPRRISAADLTARIESLEEQDETSPASPAEASDFAEFAERLGATGLADLLEAAAAFSEGVEGRPHFSRPQIIRKVAAITGQARYDREAGLRSFGTLLREGKIAKVKRGQFAITQSSRFYKEARRAGA